MSQLQDLYRDHFGMCGRPFSGLADSGVFYWGQTQVRAHAALEYGMVSGAAFIVLTGETGSGKTSLLLSLADAAADDQRMVFVAGLRRGGGSVLPWILHALGQPVTGDEGDTVLHGRVQDILIAEYAAGRRVALILDEAHNLSAEALDELRVLSNINTAQDLLVQIVLCGQPALRDRLRAPEMSDLGQRVASWGHLDALEPAAMQAYVGTRLAAAQGPEDLFDDDALAAVHAATGGLPRAINQLCELALVYAMTGGCDRIDADAIGQVLSDGLYQVPLPAPDPAPRPGRLRLAVG
ncbi:AAA family ATPase [Jannaschia sp. S6380]|uniref:ExeA family protein n=1 Tax=Jannaschia sp. S6380 TaxID=2926408 RepID=UPI001FF53D60|nr:AAA family ATPase [Jannaschia sp. S6380]MCK0168702.1 AAA family ATPase [Jannaschia sp. S6380]